MTRIYLFRLACIALFSVVLANPSLLWAKEYRTKTGDAEFTVAAPAKAITGKTHAVSIVLNTDSKTITVELPVKSFEFSNNFDSPEMNEGVHKRFNEHYMHSEQYPVVRYSGEILNLSEINFNKDGVYTIRTKGKLSISRGFQEQEIAGTVTVKGGKVSVSAKVTIYPYQYKIGIPKYIGKMYFGEVNVTTTAALQ